MAARSISVVIPVYNTERFLGDAIRSVLAQDVAVSEVVVVDDGSTDASAAVAKAFGGAVRVIERPHEGPGAARNAGVEAAMGELLAFLDADDLWAPGKLAAQLAALESQPGLAGVFGWCRQFRGVGELREEMAPEPAYVPGALLIRADAFRVVGAFATGFAVGEFIDWYARAQEAGLRFDAVPDVVLYRRRHDQNLGLWARDSRGDYTRVLRAAIERRRSQGST
jgi:glycosyltransferase involved in cell wall biosynthesis